MWPLAGGPSASAVSQTSVPGGEEEGCCTSLCVIEMHILQSVDQSMKMIILNNSRLLADG